MTSDPIFGSVPQTARLVAVRSVCAGAGRTVLAANLAFSLANRGARVCLLDLDTLWPSLHAYFGLPSRQAAVIAGLRLIEQGKLDANALEDLTVRLVAAGVSIDFISGYGLNNSAAIDSSALVELLRQLQARYDCIVIDCPVDSQINSSIDGLDPYVVLVTQSDAIQLGRFLERQHLLPATPNSVLVLNRLRASVLGARPEWQVQQLLRQRTAFTTAAIVPEDPAFDEALLRGLPLRQVAPKSKALKAIDELALRIAG